MQPQGKQGLRLPPIAVLYNKRIRGFAMAPNPAGGGEVGIPFFDCGESWDDMTGYDELA